MCIPIGHGSQDFQLAVTTLINPLPGLLLKQLQEAKISWHEVLHQTLI